MHNFCISACPVTCGDASSCDSDAFHDPQFDQKKTEIQSAELSRTALEEGSAISDHLQISSHLNLTASSVVHANCSTQLVYVKVERKTKKRKRLTGRVSFLCFLCSCLFPRVCHVEMEEMRRTMTMSMNPYASSLLSCCFHVFHVHEVAERLMRKTRMKMISCFSYLFSCPSSFSCLVYEVEAEGMTKTMKRKKMRKT